MNYELSQRFFFDAAHTLLRKIEADSSRRIHGHTYSAEVTIAGQPDPTTGMVKDLGEVRKAVADVKQQLDHHFLDEVPGLGIPTLENLCQFIAKCMAAQGLEITQVRVWREGTGDACRLTQIPRQTDLARKP